MARWTKWIASRLGLARPVADAFSGGPGARILVILIDGTMSSLRPGHETNVGVLCKLLAEVDGGQVRVRYIPGLQYTTLSSGVNVLTGGGINGQIQSAYGTLANWYRPGDKIYLVGFSRGAYAVRSLAGVMEHVGLLRADCATSRKVQQAYRFYRGNPKSEAAQAFREIHCHDTVPIAAIGVWDTVKALGVRLPLIWRLFDHQHAFHSPYLGPSTQSGFHALALDETRVAYSPVMWQSDANWTGIMEQVWFAGTHSDVGGQVRGRAATRPLSNIPLVWMLNSLEGQGLPLPKDWQTRFETDVNAPSMGQWSGSKKFFLSRAKRVPLMDASERLHDTVVGRDES